MLTINEVEKDWAAAIGTADIPVAIFTQVSLKDNYPALSYAV